MGPSLEWFNIERCLDALLDVPAEQRPAALMALAGGDLDLLRELSALSEEMDKTNTPLDRAALATFGDEVPKPSFKAAGEQVGRYKIVALLGRGGMGEVYRAERSDGEFDQQVALKLIRPEAIDHIARFQFERQLLARFNHPSITRIFDGGVLPDGQPYMVMELVDGIPVTTWCAEHHSDLNTRLGLFLEICSAVAYAHRSAVIHRDLKPANLLVTETGNVKLLDFGVAKLVDSSRNQVTLTAPFSPEYAAPEQLTGQHVSTATDVYALGVLLFELLTGALPISLHGQPLAVAMDLILNQTPPAPSELNSRTTKHPCALGALAHDLDAIAGKALRKEPEARYQTVDALIADITRAQRHEPVLARGGARAYIARRFIRRNRFPIAALATIASAVLLGLAGISWQYVRAERQAARATTIRSFLVNLFTDTDASFPADQPRNLVSAEQLVNLGVPRINRDFANDKALQFELLGAIADIYIGLSDLTRASQIQAKRVVLARELYGERSRQAIEQVLNEATSAVGAQDWKLVESLLEKSDGLLRETNERYGDMRAVWWWTKGSLIPAIQNDNLAAEAALQKAVQLFSRFNPTAVGYSTALEQLGAIYYDRYDSDQAVAYYKQALTVERSRSHPDNLMIANYEAVLSAAQDDQGDLAAADASANDSIKLAREAGGPQQDAYWYAVSNQAYELNARGLWKLAHEMFEDLFKLATPNAPSAGVKRQARVFYAKSLVREGNAATAIPILQETQVSASATPLNAEESNYIKFVLADAYEQEGRFDDADKIWPTSSISLGTAPLLDRGAYDIRQRWGEFLLDRGKLDQADAVFTAVITQQDRWGKLSTAAARAWGGRAQVALLRERVNDAQVASKTALEMLAKVRASHDVRTGAQLMLIQGAAALAAQQPAVAMSLAQKALAESQRTDAPNSAAIVRAQKAIEMAQSELAAGSSLPHH